MMRVFAALLTVALLGAGPSPAPTVATSDHLTELAGTWSCRNGYGSPGSLNVQRDGDAVVVTQTTASRNDERRDRFVPDLATRGWRTLAGSAFVGAGPAWTQPAWTLDGTFTVARNASPAHLRFERLDDRTVRIARWAGDAPPVDVVLCLRGATPPGENVCVAPDLPAIVLHAATPEIPVIRDSGQVEVQVSLDADSHITSAAIRRTNSVALNQSAMDAARRSVYRTALRDCKTVPSQYIFIVDFNYQR